MKLVHRHESCIGFSLPSIGKYKVEIWYCPSKYAIKPHSHDNINIKLMFIFGHNTKFFRSKSDGTGLITFLARARHMFKTFTIHAGDLHWFSVSTYPLVFINFETWKCKPSSAAIDFQLTTEKEFNYGRQTAKN